MYLHELQFLFWFDNTVSSQVVLFDKTYNMKKKNNYLALITLLGGCSFFFIICLHRIIYQK